MLSLIPAQLWYIVTFIGFIIGVEFHGRHHVQKLWDDDRAEIARISQTAVAAARASNELLAKTQKANYEKSRLQLTKELESVRAANHDLQLRISSVNCDASVAASAEDPAGSNGSVAGTIALPNRVTQDLLALVDDADRVVARCRVLQDQVKENNHDD